MDGEKLSINALDDVSNIMKSALRNGYAVYVEPIYEMYWKTKIDHFDITITKVEKK